MTSQMGQFVGQGTAMLTRVAGRDVALPVRFGGETSPQHELLLRFGPVEQDGGIRGHLLAEIDGKVTVARDAVLWDPVLRTFTLGDEHAVNRIADRLDPISGLLAVGGDVVGQIITGAASLFEGAMSPGVILIGGIGTIILTIYIYYMIWAILFGWALWHVFLPGGVAFVACFAIRHMRVSKLHTSLLEAAQESLRSVENAW